MNRVNYLSGDYNRGYTKAILDIIDVIKHVKYDLSMHHKTLNAKLIDELMKLYLDNRAAIRDEIGGGFIRWNCKLNKLEFYTPPKK